MTKLERCSLGSGRINRDHADSRPSGFDLMDDGRAADREGPPSWYTAVVSTSVVPQDDDAIARENAREVALTFRAGMYNERKRGEENVIRRSNPRTRTESHRE